MRFSLPTTTKQPRLVLGTYRPVPYFPRRSFVRAGSEIARHRHIIGRSGSGKSFFIVSLIEQLIAQGIAFSLIDPAGDLAFLLMHRLTDRGYFADPQAFEKLLYVDFSDHTACPPFNIFKQEGYTPKQIASTFLEACLRVWPNLAEVGVLFQDIIKHAAVVLIHHGLTLADMPRFLTMQAYREELLATCPYGDVVEFFHTEYDAWGKDAPQMRQSTLTRLRLLTFDETLKGSLSHPGNILDFRRLINTGTSVIYNLSNLPNETQRLLGCLLSLGYERAAYARADLPERERQLHFLFMDEFAMFSEHNQAALQNLLSYARKYNVFLQLAHQNFGQTDDELKNSLGNAETIAFALTHDDAKWMAEGVSRFTGLEVKHTVKDEAAQDRSHPSFWSLMETHARKTQELEDLDVGHAYAKFGKLVRRFQTLRVEPPQIPREAVHAVIQRYASRLLAPLVPVPAVGSVSVMPAEPVPVFLPPPFAKRTRKGRRKSTSDM